MADPVERANAALDEVRDFIAAHYPGFNHAVWDALDTVRAALAQQAQPVTDEDASRIALAVFDADGPDSRSIVHDIVLRYEARRRRNRMAQQLPCDFVSGGAWVAKLIADEHERRGQSTEWVSVAQAQPERKPFNLQEKRWLEALYDDQQRTGDVVESIKNIEARGIHLPAQAQPE